VIRVGVGKRGKGVMDVLKEACAQGVAFSRHEWKENVNVSRQKHVVLEDVEMEGRWKLYGGGGGSLCEN